MMKENTRDDYDENKRRRMEENERKKKGEGNLTPLM